MKIQTQTFLTSARDRACGMLEVDNREVSGRFKCSSKCTFFELIEVSLVFLSAISSKTTGVYSFPQAPYFLNTRPKLRGVQYAAWPLFVNDTTLT